jgi:hypothetical protein
MADDQLGTRKDQLREPWLWTKLFGTFKVALDPKKLLLAAAGIVVMAAGWWFWSVVFYETRPVPKESDYAGRSEDYNEAKRKYDLLERTAGRDGELRTWPWFDDRGPNQFMIIERAFSGQDLADAPKEATEVRWTKQIQVLVEPLYKFLAPVVYLFHPDAGFWNRVYFFLIILWTLATWALFGAAITRIASVQFARNEKIGMTEAVRFAWSRYVSFFSAPLFPLILVAFLTLFLIIFGFFQVVTVMFGDILIAGLLWPLVILFGLIMAVVLVGLVGWPLMYSTVAAEGSDSFDALSRSYSYVYQAPWQYLWYGFLAIVYGIVVVFFVGFMGSLTVYLGKWAVSQAPLAKTMAREPDYLFIWAPTSFHWRELLLKGGPAVYTKEDVRKAALKAYEDQQDKLLAAGKISLAENRRRKEDFAKKGPPPNFKVTNIQPGEVKPDYLESMTVWNKIGAGMVTFWLCLIFLLVVGFAYSYFWSASSIIYLLMRRKVDDTELDEVHLEDEDLEEPYTPPAPAGQVPATPGKPASPTTLIPPESLTVRSTTAPPGAESGTPPLREGASEPPKPATGYPFSAKEDVPEPSRPAGEGLTPSPPAGGTEGPKTNSPTSPEGGGEPV